MSMNSSITPIRALFMNFVYLNSLSELCMWILFDVNLLSKLYLNSVCESSIWIFYIIHLSIHLNFSINSLSKLCIQTLYIYKLFYLNSAYKSSNLCIWILYPILFIIFSFYLNLPLKINSWHTIFNNFSISNFFLFS